MDDTAAIRFFRLYVEGEWLEIPIRFLSVGEKTNTTPVPYFLRRIDVLEFEEDWIG